MNENTLNVLVALHYVLGSVNRPLRVSGIGKGEKERDKKVPALNGVDGVLLRQSVHGVLLSLRRKDRRVIRISEGFAKGS